MKIFSPLKEKLYNQLSTGIPPFYCALLYCASQILCFLQFEGL